LSLYVSDLLGSDPEKSNPFTANLIVCVNVHPPNIPQIKEEQEAREGQTVVVEGAPEIEEVSSSRVRRRAEGVYIVVGGYAPRGRVTAHVVVGGYPPRGRVTAHVVVGGYPPRGRVTAHVCVPIAARCRRVPVVIFQRGRAWPGVRQFGARGA
jgi:hypothetical protein